MDAPSTEIVSFKTADRKQVRVSRQIARQSSVFAQLLDTHADSAPSLPLDDITSQELKQVIPFLSELAESEEEEPTILEKLKRLYDTLQLSDSERFRMHSIINELGIEKVSRILPIPVQTNDEVIFWVQPLMLQSSVLRHVDEACQGDTATPLPHLNAQDFELLQHVLTKKTVEHLDPDQLGRLYSAADYLGVPIESYFRGIGREIGLFLSKKFEDVHRFTFSPAATYIVVEHINDMVQIINMTDCSVFMTFENVINEGVWFSHDDEHIAVECIDGTGGLVNTVDRSELWFKDITQLRFSDNSNFLIVEYNDTRNTVEIIHAKTQVVAKGFDNVSFLQMSADGSCVAVGHKDDTGQLINLRNKSVRKEFVNIYHDGFRLSPDGNYCTVEYKDNTGQLLSTADGSVLISFTDVDTFCFSRDSASLSVQHCGGSGQLIRLDTLQRYLPAQAALLLKAMCTSKNDQTVSLSQSEYGVYHSLDDHAQEKIQNHVYCAWYAPLVNWVKTHQKTVGFIAGLAAAAMLSYGQKNQSAVLAHLSKIGP